jgi:hypothetical protein
MCINANKNLLVRVHFRHIYNGFTVSAGVSLITEDVLKEVMVTAYTQPITIVVRSRECKQSIDGIVIETSSRRDCPAHTILQV